MRRIRTVTSLLEYLDSINCPMSRSTVNKLIRTNEMPYIRVSERVLIFDLDAIDNWLSIDNLDE
ncbi:helix-turn-helix transcriptional regulator [Psychrobacillus sp. NPDC096426]|uniref:helix-turn-helix transcriptional regulator n=1 Tax=Psychrobacillus sp. NPDC096426 TaxID=3364491 RepID=UPI0037FC37BD